MAWSRKEWVAEILRLKAEGVSREEARRIVDEKYPPKEAADYDPAWFAAIQDGSYLLDRKPA